ncbi:MAG: hypothetical protein QW303_08080 [Nitrososphaerota archaeon]
MIILSCGKSGEEPASNWDKFSYQEYPSIHKNLVVWQDNRNGNWDIFLYDINTGKETQLTSDPSDQTEPKIYGNYVVWLDNRHGDNTAAIYLFDITSFSERVISKETANNPDYESYDYSDLSICGRYVAWIRHVHGQKPRFDVILYDIDEGLLLNLTENEDGKLKGRPVVFSNTVCWTYGSYIVCYNIDTGQKTLFDMAPINIGRLDVYKNTIALEGNTNGNTDIYLFNLSNEQLLQLTTEPHGQENPHIYGSIVVWEDKRFTDNPLELGNIGMLDLNKMEEKIIDKSEYAQFSPDIWGNYIVWTDFREWSDIYLYNISTGGVKRISPI